MPILTAQRLLDISTRPLLGSTWYLIAAVTMTVCNQPQEIPVIYHYAMHTGPLARQPSIELYSKVESVVGKFAEIRDTGRDREYNPYEGKEAFGMTDKVRESLLKTAALCGLPKSINSLMTLKDTTPVDLRQRDPEATNRPQVANWEQYKANQQRGREFWDATYGKVSRRITNQMSQSYPDLWQYALADVYSDLLSYCGVLSHEETSVIVVSALIPQDVNPQLKGHLRGAEHNGVSVETLREVRRLAMDLAEWSGVEWKGPVEDV